MNIDPVSPSSELMPVTRSDLLTWTVVAFAMVLTLLLHLLPALLGGLAVYELVAVLSRWLRFAALSSDWARALAVALLATVVITLLTLAGLGAAAYIRHSSASLPALIQKLTDGIEAVRDVLPGWIADYLPSDPQLLRKALVEMVRTHTGALSIAGREVGRALAHVLIGMILGALLALRGASARHDQGPFALAGTQTAERFALSFRRVVFAQAWIALVNTFFTALYLLLVLPLSGIHLPLVKSMIALTLVAGLIPIAGNLISNTFVVAVSLTDSMLVAAASLLFLIAVHKLEYFLNARIIGSQIRARAWELLLAMLVLEAVFGLAGLIAAPIFYAYYKHELIEHGLI